MWSTVGGFSDRTIALNGINARLPSSTKGRRWRLRARPAKATKAAKVNQEGQQGQQNSTITVGENAAGQGTITTNGDTVSVPNTSTLESLSCTSASQCYAVGLAPSNNDEGVLRLDSQRSADHI